MSIKPEADQPNPLRLKLDVEKVEELIRAEKDPAALQAKLTAMIEEAHPATPFIDGQIMPLYIFERIFKRRYCDNVEPAWLQWQVLVRVGDFGRVTIDFGPTRNSQYASASGGPENKDEAPL